MEKINENKNLKRSIIAFLIVLILLLIIIYIIIINRKVVIFDGNGADSGEMKSIVTFSKLNLEKNNFEKAGYTFIGWKVYNDKTSKYSCEEGWYTEEEIKENNYTLKYLTTEEMVEELNSIRGNNFIVTAQWKEDEQSIDKENLNPNNENELFNQKDDNKNLDDKDKNINNSENKDKSDVKIKDENNKDNNKDDNKNDNKDDNKGDNNKPGEEKPNVPERSDLDKLKDRLIGEEIDEEKLGEQMEYDPITIKTDDKIYKEKDENGDEIKKNKITYNDKDYTIIIDKDGKIIDVVENKEEVFKYGEPYSNEKRDVVVKIFENESFEEYELSTGKFLSKETEQIKIYQNKIYTKISENEYEYLGDVSENGFEFSTGDEEIFKYDPYIEYKLHICKEHYDTKIIDATCTENGKKIMSCKICHSTEEEVILALGHNFSEWTVKTEATCETAGEEIRICSRCNKEETRATEELGHRFSEWTVKTEATCETAGEEIRICSRCNKEETRATEELGHRFSEWTVKTEATCETAGEEIRTCSRCKKEETKTIPALEHSFSEWTVKTEATCETPGEKTRTCSRCNKEETKTIEALEHSLNDWTVKTEVTCETAGKEVRICSRCNKEIEVRESKALGHDFSNETVTIEATCETAGEKTISCTRCNKSKTETISALGHSFSDWIVKTEATCETAGEKTRTCSRCNKEETKTIPALEHNYTRIEVQPSYTGKGYYQYTCTKCSKSYTEDTHKDLVLINGTEQYTSSDWATSFKDNNQSGMWSSGFGGAISGNLITVCTSYINNYGSAYTKQAINLTDVKQIVFTYKQYDNLYSTKKGGILNLQTLEQKGVNKTTVGIANESQKNKEESFVKSASTTYTRTSSSDTPVSYTKTIDVSGLTGNYYIKMYVSHSWTGDDNGITANTAYTGFSNIKLIYN